MGFDITSRDISFCGTIVIDLLGAPPAQSVLYFLPLVLSRCLPLQAEAMLLAIACAPSPGEVIGPSDARDDTGSQRIATNRAARSHLTPTMICRHTNGLLSADAIRRMPSRPLKPDLCDSGLEQSQQFRARHEQLSTKGATGTQLATLDQAVHAKVIDAEKISRFLD